MQTLKIVLWSWISNYRKRMLSSINYLTMQLIPKSQDKTICSCSHNNNHKNKIHKDKDSDTELEKKIHQSSDCSRRHGK